MNRLTQSTFFKSTAITLALSITAMVVSPSSAYSASLNGPVSVPAGTVVQLQTQETITTKNLKSGDSIKFLVASDVIVDQKVVISKGSSATGEVISAKKPGILGAPGEIMIKIKNVTAVDGTTVLLTTDKTYSGDSKQTESILLTLICCILFVAMKGKDAEIKQGTTIDAMVLAPTTVNAN